MADARTRGWSRRAVLAGVGAAPLMGFANASEAMKANEPLKEHAGRAGMQFGAAVRASLLAEQPDYRAAVTRECNIVTPELELKWAWLEPERGQLSFTSADAIAGFAASTGKAMHGAALLWHLSIAPWAAEALADQPDWMIVRRFIASVIPRYGEVTHTWDVINEPMDMGHRMDGLRPSPYLAAFGPDYIRRALEDARLYAPRAKLFINEFGLDYDFPVERDKRYLLLKLLEGLKTSGAPIDGLGMQAHLELAKQEHFDPKVLAQFFDDVGSLGLEIRISELDVKEANGALPTAERDARVADAVRRYLDVAMANRAVGSITTWGLSDRCSWLESPGAGGGPNRGLPLDTALRPKPMYHAISEAYALRGG